MHKKTARIFTAVAISFIIQNTSFSKALVGEISKADFQPQRTQVIDEQTKQPLEGAIVSIPAENKIDFTDKNGLFKLSPSSNTPVILSIQKDGYRPFSLTLKDGKLNGNVHLELEKITPMSIVVSDNMMHLGDNSFSKDSAGACLINSPCVGPSFTKHFVANDFANKKAYVVIGSVIGIDTVQAMRLGQNNLSHSTSSPMEIFVNREKIGEIKINGDNQKIPIPKKLLKKNNTLTVKTGMNLAAKDYTDYDDVELMNLIVDIQ